MAEPLDEPLLSDSERARLKHRERKRETRMVVDNAGVKKVQRAISQRAPSRKAKPAKR